MKYDKKLAESIINSIDFKDVTPNKEDVLKAFNIDNVKVVILGQDPYPTKNVANGIAFGVNKDVKIPQSLKQIFKEIEMTYGKIITDRTLQSWVDQGVLLLNTALTTKIGFPGSHIKIWENFINGVIDDLGQDPNIVWILWGNHAKKYLPYIKSKKIVMDAHPSPLSRRYRKGNTFKDIEQFIKINW